MHEKQTKLVIPLSFSIDENLYPTEHLNGFRCSAVPYLQVVSIGASIFCLVAIAAERYRVICNPGKPKFGHRGTVKMVVVVGIPGWTQGLVNRKRRGRGPTPRKSPEFDNEIVRKALEHRGDLIIRVACSACFVVQKNSKFTTKNV